MRRTAVSRRWPTFTDGRASGRALGQLSVMLAAGLMLLFLVVPIVALLVRSLQVRGWESVPDSGIPPAVLLSFITTGISVLLTLLLGTPLAYLFARRRFPLKRFLNILIELPIVLPPAVAGLALLIAFGRRGLFGPLLLEFGVTLPFTMAAVVLAQMFVSAPFFIRSAQVGFQGVPREIEDAARVDGADGWTLFRYITLPLAGRALGSGLILSWARALGEFGATILFAGSLQGRTQTMPLLIYNVLERDVDAAIWTGLMLVGLAVLALLLSQWLRRGSEAE